MLRDERRFGDVLAVAALVVYLVGEYLFRYATLGVSFPAIAELHFAGIFEVSSVALAVAAIVTRRRTLSCGAVALFAVTLALLLLSSQAPRARESRQGGTRRLHV